MKTLKTHPNYKFLKYLNKPDIAINILINIYNTMKRKNKLSLLKNTKLGTFYQSQPYFIQKGGI